jgi:hypothetical protein
MLQSHFYRKIFWPILVALTFLISACGGVTSSSSPSGAGSSNPNSNAPAVNRPQLGATLADFQKAFGPPATPSDNVMVVYNGKINGAQVRLTVTVYVDGNQVLRADDIRVDPPEGTITPQAGDAICESLAPADKSQTKVDQTGAPASILHTGMSATLGTVFGSTFYQTFQANGGAAGSYYDSVTNLPDGNGTLFFETCELSAGVPS